MPLYDDAKELLGAINEIKRLRDQIGKLAASFEDTRSRLNELERRIDRILSDQQHHVERTKLAADAGVAVGLARLEGDLKAKLVELDLRLQAVERASGTQVPSRRLPPA